jgi:hypothetical protein
MDKQYRLYKVDSIYAFKDEKDAEYRAASKNHDKENLDQQQQFNDYSFNQSQLFKDMDKNYRGYKVDSLYYYKENRDEVYRQALHADSKNGYNNQKKIEHDAENRSVYYNDMDKNYRGYKIDSIYAYVDNRNETYRQATTGHADYTYQTQKVYDQEAFDRQSQFNSKDEIRQESIAKTNNTIDQTNTSTNNNKDKQESFVEKNHDNIRNDANKRDIENTENTSKYLENSGGL